MREKRLSASPPAVGGSSLLVIFAVLCLTVFALLALSTVQADRRLSTASADAVTAYYAADAKAEEVLARLRLGEVPADVSVSGDTYSYTVPVSDTLALEVAVQPDGAEWRVLRWQTVSIAGWQPEDDLNVWDGAPQ